jgi:ABC-type Fe3+-hydroxamate transport system substrate-binding protein
MGRLVNIFNEILGKEIAVPESPGRIISLSPAITEALFLMGLGERGWSRQLRGVQLHHRRLSSA